MAASIAMLTTGLLFGRLTRKQKSTKSKAIDISTRTAQAVTSILPDNRMQGKAPPQIEMTENAAYGVAQVKTHDQEDEVDLGESSMYCEVNNLP